MLERPGYTCHSPEQLGIGWEAAHLAAKVLCEDYTDDGKLDPDLWDMILRMTVIMQRRYEYV